MPPTVTRGSTVSHLAPGKNPDDRARPSTTVDRPRAARSTKIQRSHSDHPSDPSSSRPASASWLSARTRQYPILTAQAQKSTMHSHPSLRNQSASQPVPTSQAQASVPMGTRQASRPQSQVAPAPQQQHQPGQSLSQGPRQAVAPKHTQHPMPQGQKQQGQPQRLQHLPQQRAYQGQLPQNSSSQQQNRAYLTSRHPQHAMYMQQQHLPPQHMQQHLSQRRVSQQPIPQPQQSLQTPPSHMNPQHMVSQQRLAQQMRSHQSSQQQHKSNLQQTTQQYVQAPQMNQGVQHQQQQVQQQYQRGHSQDAQAQLAQMQSADPSYSAAGPKSDFDQRYTQQPLHHFQQQAQKNQIQDPHVQNTQQPHLQTAPVLQAQQHPSQQVNMAQGAQGSGNVNPAPPMANGNIHGGQLYPVGMGLPPNAMSSAGIQYAGSYASTGLFDPLNMNPSGLPLANIGLGQAGPNQGVNVRDLERQGQHHQMQQIAGRSAVHPSERNGVIAQDLQRYVEQGQHQVAQRAGIQGHPPQDLQGHVISHIQAPLYQPLEQQQGTQHLVLNQNTGLAQQQGSVAMQSQAVQLPQHTAQLSPPDDQFDQQVYQNAAQNQLSGAPAGAIQQGGDLSTRKGTDALPQQELLPWSGGNSNARVIGNGLQQHANGTMTNAVTPGSLITQSQLLEMGVSDGRSQSQNGTGQVSQQTRMPTAPQRSVGSMRRLPASGDNGSPRKRRQTNTGVPSPLDASRSFSCSGCGQDFARKRDRDHHVRTVHERSFSCTKCQSRFKTKSDANRHIRIVHERVRPYPCPSCPSMFSERNKLRRHKETVHEKLRPYVCPVCSARFGELGNLRQHTGSLHPDYQVESAPGRTRVNNQVQS